MQHILSFSHPIFIREWATVGGREESRGPLREAFDLLDDTDRFGMPTWETAEGEMERQALNIALKKAGISPDELSLLAAGDLQNQCTATANGLSSFHVPYLGLYGACSTLTEGLIVISAFLSGREEPALGAVVTGSHNAAAERQFRTPLEYGAQRPGSAQWTATAAGAYLLSQTPSEIAVTRAMPGCIRSGGITDASNMGAAMAPAAAESILSYFEKTGDSPDDYDVILTGDLGRVGSDILRELLDEEYPGAPHALSDRHKDCGLLLYDFEKQDVHSGASGCGCSAAVLGNLFLPKVKSGELRRMLLLSTGALMSPTSVMQNIPIYGIAPLVKIEHFQKNEVFIHKC